jgi:hypothetical protein
MARLRLRLRWRWPEVRRVGGAVVLVGGPVAPGADATTLGSVILMRRRAADDAELLAHELVHVRQWRELGFVGFLVRYLRAYLRARLMGYPHWGAYRRIPLEVEATWLARLEMLHPGTPDPGTPNPGTPNPGTPNPEVAVTPRG